MVCERCNAELFATTTRNETMYYTQITCAACGYIVDVQTDSDVAGGRVIPAQSALPTSHPLFEPIKC